MKTSPESSDAPVTGAPFDRRKFIRRSGAVAASLTVLPSGVAFSSEANSRIRIGMVGCGDRGSWIAGLMKNHGGYEITAAADYFAGRAGKVAKDHGLPATRQFTGLTCHEKLLADGSVDAVAIISPPYFHPGQAAAAVAAGKHVFLAKPVAVDVPGCHAIQAAADKATANRLCFLVDFQTRANTFYQEALRRVHSGALGDFCYGEALYHAGRLARKADPGGPEARLRNWVFDRKLSGDIITEQNIHTLDVMNWIFPAPPLKATGTGGRKVRLDVGDTWDHFALLFEYPNDVGVTFSSRQFGAHGTPGGIINRMFGSKGVLLTTYGGDVMIRGGKDAFYRGGKTSRIYQEGCEENIKSFHDSIRDSKFDNPTVAPSVRSNLIAILGRTAAYDKRQVTWDELVRSQDKFEPDLEGLDA